jgi:predicted CXXCH cytochrome family protein
MKNLFLILPLLLGFFSVSASSIIGSKHDFSATTGGSSIKAVTETDTCVFCHTAHYASGVTPLWNHNMSSVSNYIVYSSARLTALNVIVPQPNGSSRLCLSCHDGTVALGGVSSGAPEIQMTSGGTSVTTMPADNINNVGTDLSNDHPVSFLYDAALAARDPEVVAPSKLTGKVRLDSQSRVQCVSCHDPHDNQFGNFLVMNNNGSALCLNCHQPSQWLASQHASSTQVAPASVVAKVAKTSQLSGRVVSAKAVPTTMQAIACENCHVNHRSGSQRHLLQSAIPEQNCLNCHNGITGKKNVAADFQKSSIHPIEVNSQSHSPVEDIVNPKMRHVVCVDCHDPHAANSKSATAPMASGALANVAGVTAGGGVLKPLQKEYELCFRCHADSLARGSAVVSRQFIQTNTRLQFSAGNRSFHPVTAVGKNFSTVPSLIAPWLVTSQMYCSDCHNSDSSPAAGSNGANGPHGSIYRPILERNLEFTDGQPESAAVYALCYKCHSRSVVLSPASFPLHLSHVMDDKSACTTCHDSHGVANAPHLINFNTTYVTPSSTGQLSYTSTGNSHGVCTLTCHGKDHKNTSY